VSFVLVLRYVKEFFPSDVVKVHNPVGVDLFTVCAGNIVFDALDIFSDFKTFFVALHRSVSAIID